MVAELRQESHDPILCYKRQGILDPDFPHFPEDAFVLAFQTRFQKELYEMFASTIVCIDSTHKTNSHNFKLITVVVPDEYGEGIAIYRCMHLVTLANYAFTNSYRTTSGLVYYRQGRHTNNEFVPW